MDTPTSAPSPSDSASGRDWTAPTPFDTHFGTVKELVKPIAAYQQAKTECLAPKDCLQKALLEIPTVSGWVRESIPQFERCEGKTVIFVGGSCLHTNKRFNYDDYTPQSGAPVTNVIIQAFEVYMQKHVLLIDMRKVRLGFSLGNPVYACRRQGQ
jgi:hypothetical protein